MYPTLFRIPFLPEAWADVKSYGAMMTVAFLGGIWFSCRRAMRVQADPDVVLNIGFISLIAGVVGARIMYVVHYWDSRFANQPSPLWAIFDIRAGGLEFLGGPILVIPAVMIYLKMTRNSARWYLDIAGPSLMFGLAMARIGCFLNGCCWGAVCVDTHDPTKAALPWAVRYPYGSPAMIQQYQFGQLDLPKELIWELASGQSYPVPRDQVEADRTALDGPARDLQAAEQELEVSRQLGRDPASIAAIEARIAKLRQAESLNRSRYFALFENGDKYGLLPSELRDISRHFRSRPSHPAQLYACITGLVLYWMLHTMFYWRKRHGIIIPWLLVTYGVARLLEEAIRQDNPLDVGGLTISQGLSLGLMVVGIAMLLYLRKLPLKSPLARKFELPPAEEPAPA